MIILFLTEEYVKVLIIIQIFINIYKNLNLKKNDTT